jgi:CBS domain-containing membrane protein
MIDKTPETCQPRVEITNEDLQAALRDMHTYMDISIDDLKTLCTLAAQHAQERMLQKIPVRDIMTTQVITIGPDADIHYASQRLADHKIKGLPVVDEENIVIGIITEADILEITGVIRGHSIRDVLRHLLGEPVQPIPEGTSLRKFMSVPAITTGPDADIRRAAKMMIDRKVKRLPVVDDQGKLLGIVSRSDIIRRVGINDVA